MVTTAFPFHARALRVRADIFALLLIVLSSLSQPSIARQGSRQLVPPKNVSAAIVLQTSGGVTRPVVRLTWDTVQYVRSYRVDRGGVSLASPIVGSAYTDTAVSEGQTYSYQVRSILGGRVSAPSTPAVTILVPILTPPGPVPLPPANLRVLPLWSGAPTDTLSWDVAPDAVRYRVYQYDRLLGETSDTNFAIPTDKWVAALTYYVTSIRADGKESIPSNIGMAIGGANPARRPDWPPAPPTPPGSLIVLPQWNHGRPRNLLTWKTWNPDNWTHNVYRDGVRIAQGVTSSYYTDDGIGPGEAHAYSVSGANWHWTTYQESAQCPSVSAVSRTGPAGAGGNITITGVVPNDDSAIIAFTPFPGAADYRARSLVEPGVYKYSGGSLSIEVNGLAPGVPATFVIEAIDKLGPFQKIDGDLGPGGHHADGTRTSHINGQGAPSNEPVVVASSPPVTLTPQARTLTGAQTFFDTFRDFAPLVQVSVDPRIIAAQGGPAGAGIDPDNVFVREWQNDRWIVRNYIGDFYASRIFVMSNHLMETLYDGNTTFRSWPPHNNDSTITFTPKATADLTGGRILHVTFEVDAHFDGRRWVDVVVADSREPLVKPNDVFFHGLPVPSGRLFRLDQFPDHALLTVGTGDAGNGKMTFAEAGVGGARQWIGGYPGLNGTTGDLDKRHRFDLYLSATRCRLIEAGYTLYDGPLPTPLTFPLDRVAVYFEHQVYHTGNDRPELIRYAPDETYWINHRPWADERHWDNMGFEVLSAFPASVGLDAVPASLRAGKTPMARPKIRFVPVLPYVSLAR